MSSMEPRAINHTNIQYARKLVEETNRMIDPRLVKHGGVTSYGKLMEIAVMKGTCK